MIVLHTQRAQGRPGDRRGACALLALPVLLTLGAPAPALATDTWSTVAPGIRHLHRVTGSQDYHVVTVDLTRPEIYLRATGPGQNGQRTSAWAASVGATLAINGDLWDADNWSAYEPLGLAVGEGWKWREDTDTWSFLACDVNKRCRIDGWGSLVANDPRWHNAIGGMQDLLVIDGVGQSYAASYYQQRNPRTASGLTQDGNTLILLVVDGRRSGAAGMNFAELTAVMLEFGAYRAINHDGGGSSTLVIGGAVRNVPSDGGERVVANHLGILVSGHTDPACAGHENARLCVDGHNMRTCTGGLDRGLGDCGYFGLACEQQADFAYCVDPRCTQGGQNAVCVDATRIGFCSDGVYSEGDCAGFGLPCVEGLGTAWCWADFYQATPVASSLGSATGGAIDVVAGVPTSLWFELRNSGRVAWDERTRLAPIPRDVASPLAAPGWIAGHRIAAVAQATPAGQVGRFTFDVVAPTAGDHELVLGLVQEGVAWFADPPAGGGPRDGTLRVILRATAAPDAGTGSDAARPDAAVPDATTDLADGVDAAPANVPVDSGDGAPPGSMDAGPASDAGSRDSATVDRAAPASEPFGCRAAPGSPGTGLLALAGLLAGGLARHSRRRPRRPSVLASRG